MYGKFDEGTFPNGAATPVDFDGFVEYVHTDESLFDLWGDDVDDKKIGRRPPRARGATAASSGTRPSRRRELFAPTHGRPSP